MPNSCAGHAWLGWRRSIASAICGALLAAQPVRAQLRGTVVDDSGNPIPSVQVELWTLTSRLATTLTDDNGRFVFGAVGQSSALALLARRLGFGPTRVPLTAPNDTITIHLHALGAPLPTVTVLAAARLCPNRDSPAARAVWDRSRQTYSSGVAYSRGADYTALRNVVRAADIGNFDDAKRTLGSRQYSVAGIFGLRSGIEQYGYVWREANVHVENDYGVWFYPPLQAEYAEHFADSLFAARHTFSVVSAGEETVIGYCPKDHKLPGLQGTLRIAADGSFIEARWRFWNPVHNPEEAGGDVVFAPRDPEHTHGLLLAAQGVFWRRLPSGLYYQDSQAYSEWTVVEEKQER